VQQEAGGLGEAVPLAVGRGQSFQSAASGAVRGRQEVEALETTAEVPILMYHSIDDAGPIELARYRLSPAVFASQMRYLADHGYHSISLEYWAEAIAAGRRLAGRPIIITFDDGYLNFMHNAWPALERADFTATMFVVTDKVGQTADWDRVTGEHLQLMSWEHLRPLRDRGLKIGSHTARHPSLLSLSSEEIVDEGARARTRLQEELGIDATCFAFPYGHTDERVREAVAQAGYTIAVGTTGGTSTLLHDPLNLPRIEIFPEDDLTSFATKVARIRPRLPESMSMRTARLASRVCLHPDSHSQGDPMLIHPDYAQKLAAQLDALVGDFVALHSQILTAGGQGPTLQSKLAQLFREPITGKMQRNVGPYETITGGFRVGFEKEARVTLEVEPKLDHSISPENCVNTLKFNLTGPSRWLSLECACEWADMSSAQRYQLGIYATVSRSVPGRAVLRLPGKDGEPIDVVFANFELAKERRNLNKSGELPHVDFMNVNTDQRPILLVDFDTKDKPDIHFQLHYISVYFD
jgi:peptidoglycan/xylan/chitin deacetylase (PgdA/CDA1 family)